jgi:hypothetical protein
MTTLVLLFGVALGDEEGSALEHLSISGHRSPEVMREYKNMLLGCFVNVTFCKQLLWQPNAHVDGYLLKS